MKVLIQDIYSSFPVPPNLIVHQIRVASIVYFILFSLNKDMITPVSAALLHDLGNLTKFDLSSLDKVEFCRNNECLKYWREQQKQIHKQISKNTDEVTITFLKQAKVNDTIIKFLKEIFTFDFNIENLDTLTLEQKVVIYADMRTAPYGITTLEQRNNDSRKRYAQNPNSPFTEKDFQKFEQVGQAIEQEIIKLGINTNHISDKNLSNIQDVLYNFEVPTQIR